MAYQVFDPASGMYFYYNAKTGESKWEKPKALGDEEVKVGTGAPVAKKDKPRVKREYPATLVPAEAL